MRSFREVAGKRWEESRKKKDRSQVVKATETKWPGIMSIHWPASWYGACYINLLDMLPPGM